MDSGSDAIFVRSQACYGGAVCFSAVSFVFGGESLVSYVARSRELGRDREPEGEQAGVRAARSCQLQPDRQSWFGEATGEGKRCFNCSNVRLLPGSPPKSDKRS